MQWASCLEQITLCAHSSSSCLQCTGRGREAFVADQWIPDVLGLHGMSLNIAGQIWRGSLDGVC